MAVDYYAELGVSKTASQDEIRKAYRKLAAKFHPDKRPDDKAAEAKFKTINRAHQILGDATKRKLYDDFGEDGLREGFDAEAARAYGGGGRVRFRRGGQGASVEDIFGGAGGANIGDLFGDLFGARARAAQQGGPRAAAKGADVGSEVTVDFAAALNGVNLKLRVQDGGEELTVRIPPGADDGDKVRLRGHGAPGPNGGPPGDLVLTIRVKPHPYFDRDGLDLQLDLPISVGEAYRGAKVRVPTPSGDVTLTVPQRAQSGQVLRLKERGVKRGEKVGDLYVRFQIRLPVSDAKDVAKAVETLDKATGPADELRAALVF
ncbi:MAG: J domain-containing protein [Polyangiaceae bacterium]|nr:J domain-containing protein [Polyangiaceae bacterium]